jgi:large conductance mechanosensitive channel
MKGFKDFVMRGNLIELAVAFIMAAAFAAVVTTFTNWLLSLIPAGATNFGDTKFGLFLTALVSSSSSLRSSIFSSSPIRKS